MMNETNEEATFLNYEQCPECRTNHRDNAGDNLARYSDGHGYCFSCQYFEKSEEELKTELSMQRKETEATIEEAKKTLSDRKSSARQKRQATRILEENEPKLANLGQLRGKLSIVLSPQERQPPFVLPLAYYWGIKKIHFLFVYLHSKPLLEHFWR